MRSNELEHELLIFDRPTGLHVGDDWNMAPRHCCECGDEFTPKRETQIRCVPCNAEKHA